MGKRESIHSGEGPEAARRAKQDRAEQEDEKGGSKRGTTPWVRSRSIPSSKEVATGSSICGSEREGSEQHHQREGGRGTMPASRNAAACRSFIGLIATNYTRQGIRTFSAFPMISSSSSPRSAKSSSSAS
eukprot:980448-Rhodomonas_salina.1